MGDGNTLVAMAAAMREPKVVVLGGGSWGTTVASICARRAPTLQWVRSEETANDINENRAHGRDERVPVASFYKGDEYLYRLVKRLAGGG